MKKTLAMILAALCMATLLVGCSDEDTTSGDSSANSEAESSVSAASESSESSESSAA